MSKPKPSDDFEARLRALRDQSEEPITDEELAKKYQELTGRTFDFTVPENRVDAVMAEQADLLGLEQRMAALELEKHRELESRVDSVADFTLSTSSYDDLLSDRQRFREDIFRRNAAVRANVFTKPKPREENAHQLQRVEGKLKAVNAAIKAHPDHGKQVQAAAEKKSVEPKPKKVTVSQDKIEKMKAHAAKLDKHFGHKKYSNFLNSALMQQNPVPHLVYFVRQVKKQEAAIANVDLLASRAKSLAEATAGRKADSAAIDADSKPTAGGKTDSAAIDADSKAATQSWRSPKKRKDEVDAAAKELSEDCAEAARECLEYPDVTPEVENIDSDGEELFEDEGFDGGQGGGLSELVDGVEAQLEEAEEALEDTKGQLEEAEEHLEEINEQVIKTKEQIEESDLDIAAFEADESPESIKDEGYEGIDVHMFDNHGDQKEFDMTAAVSDDDFASRPKYGGFECQLIEDKRGIADILLDIGTAIVSAIDSGFKALASLFTSSSSDSDERIALSMCA
jgi:hypothetical protein